MPHRTLGIAGGALAAAALLIAMRGTVVPIMQSSITIMSANAAEIFSVSDRSDRLNDTISLPARTRVDGYVSRTPLPNGAGTQLPVPALSAALDATESMDSVQLDVSADPDAVTSWEEVKATTWVNVRADRRRDASILAVLNPDDIVRLGARESGWRQVNVDGATGWVDGRHFTPSSRQ